MHGLIASSPGCTYIVFGPPRVRGCTYIVFGPSPVLGFTYIVFRLSPILRRPNMAFRPSPVLRFAHIVFWRPQVVRISTCKILPPIGAICLRNLEEETLSISSIINLTPEKREHTGAVATAVSRNNVIAVR